MAMGSHAGAQSYIRSDPAHYPKRIRAARHSPLWRTDPCRIANIALVAISCCCAEDCAVASAQSAASRRTGDGSLEGGELVLRKTLEMRVHRDTASVRPISHLSGILDHHGGSRDGVRGQTVSTRVRAGADRPAFI